MWHFQVKKLGNSNLMQAYMEFLIWFGSTRCKLLTFLNRSRSIGGWTVLSLWMTTSIMTSMVACIMPKPSVCNRHSEKTTWGKEFTGAAVSRWLNMVCIGLGRLHGMSTAWERVQVMVLPSNLFQDHYAHALRLTSQTGQRAQQCPL